MAVTAVSGVEIRRPVPRLRRLEDERWLALALLLPTAVLLGLFIAYPFFEGVMLSLSSARSTTSSGSVHIKDRPIVTSSIRRPLA